MLAYVCDWCKRPRKERQRWILGFAAERIGAGGVQREISIASAWSDKLADHPLAVHFCCEEHKQAYVRTLFDSPHSGETSDGVPSAEEPPQVFLVRERSSSARRRTRRPKIKFTPADRIHSRGLGVRLDHAGPSPSVSETE